MPTEPADDDEIEQHYSAKELAAKLSLHRDTIYDYAARGEIPSVRICGSVRFPHSALVKFLREKTTGDAA